MLFPAKSSQMLLNQPTDGSRWVAISNASKVGKFAGFAEVSPYVFLTEISIHLFPGMEAVEKGNCQLRVKPSKSAAHSKPGY